MTALTVSTCVYRVTLYAAALALTYLVLLPLSAALGLRNYSCMRSSQYHATPPAEQIRLYTYDEIYNVNLGMPWQPVPWPAQTGLPAPGLEDCTRYVTLGTPAARSPQLASKLLHARV